VSDRELAVLGTASQAPTRMRNHNGYFLRWDGEGLLFDPGEGTQRQMLFAGVTASQITRICIRGAGPVFVDAGAFRLEARALSHSVPTVGYRLAEPDGRRMLPGKLAALGIAGPDIGRLQRSGRLEAGGRVVTIEQVSEPRPGQRFAFIMDTRLCDAAFELADQADMLVCESTFANAEAALARDYGHLTAGQAGQIAARAGVRLLVLTHFSQRYESGSGSGGDERLAGEAAEVFGGEVVVARDLIRVPVPPRHHWAEA
jgi:ribonuclease Z